MKAVIESLRALREPCEVLIRTDSTIVIAWCKGSCFEKKPKMKKKYPLAWCQVEEYREISKKHRITFEHIRSHSGDPDNERCDKLARAESQKPF